MKFIHKVLAITVALGFLSACDTTDLDLQENPNAITPESASINDLYNSIQVAFEDFYNDAQKEPGTIARMYHAAGFSYEESTTPATFNGAWNSAYAALFADIQALEDLNDDGTLGAYTGSAKVLKAYALLTLVDLFGNVPEAEALQGIDAISPTATNGETVYATAIALLETAKEELSGATNIPAYDNFYGGDLDAWRTAANSLILKAALNTGDVAAINSVVSSAVGVISSNAEDFEISYGGNRANPDARHPFYGQQGRLWTQYETGDGDYLSNYYMWLLKADKESVATGNTITDPRIRYYFYRKTDDAVGQDPTTYGCHLSVLPDQSFAPSHWNSVDPDLPYCVASEDGYSGRDHLNGQGIPPDGPIRTSYGLYPGGGIFDDDSFQDTRNLGPAGGGGSGAGIAPLMLASFVDFMQAEAVIRLNANGNARSLLESGIRKSMNKVIGFESLVETQMSTEVTLRDGSSGTIRDLYGSSTADVNNYIDEVLAIYDAAGSDAERLDVVIKEFYIAAWGNGIEAYNMYRRTGMPANMQPALEEPPGQFPYTFFLPDQHVTRNQNVSQKVLSDRVFWDSGLTLY